MIVSQKIYQPDYDYRPKRLPLKDLQTPQPQEGMFELKRRQAARDALLIKLANRDREVRDHEMAHQMAGAGLVRGGASLQYVVGPGGKLYATGGEVAIDAGEGTSPEDTIVRAERIAAAALAPKDPSPQDLKVASTALLMAQRARMALEQDQRQTALQSAIKIYQEMDKVA